LGKSTKTASTRDALFDDSMHQIVCLLGLRSDPTVGAYSAPPDPHAVFRGPTSKGRGREEGKSVGEGSGGEREERRGRGEERGGGEGGGEGGSSSFAL